MQRFKADFIYYHDTILPFKLERDSDMIILGKKHLFTDLELQKLEALQGPLLQLSLSEMDEHKAKQAIIDFIDVHGLQMIVLNTRKPPTNPLLSFLTRLELEDCEFMTTENLMERYLHKCYIPVDNSDISYLGAIRPFNSFQLFQKRVIDYLGVTALAVISIPVVLYSVYRIKKESPGPVFFRQQRIGRRGKTFTCFKFRSMHINSHHDPYTRDNDTRIFPYGEFMRKARIDELPQIINVFKGDMHLIGPRAEWDILAHQYAEQIPFYHERHLVSPGVTGNAQVRYPYGRNIEDTRQKLMYDFYYIKYWSLFKEFGIIWQTIAVVLGKKGI